MSNAWLNRMGVQGLACALPRVSGLGLLWPFLMGLGALIAALHWDDALWRLRGGQGSGALHATAQFLSTSANGGVLIPVGAALAAWMAWRGRRAVARLALAMAMAGSIAGASGTVLRSAIGRARPLAPVQQGWHGPRVDGHWVFGRHAYASFPSGHTSLAAGFGSFLFLHRRRSGMLGLGYAAAVAWSRVELGAHRPSDVIAGLLVGSSVALAVGPFMLATARGWLPDKPVDGGTLPASP
jgi:membrane-associated phospholipid phosphatase